MRWLFQQKIREGPGPINIDCRHLNEKYLTHLAAAVGYDKDTLPDHFERRGEDLGARPVEITVSFSGPIMFATG
jgi:hypothetical protein